MDQMTLAQRVYEQLKDRLRLGTLRPGTRLVNRTLAAELGTSTIPVREAISRLASEGLLELSPGAGAFVRSPDLNELGEIYDVREALEVMAAGEAARFANQHLVSELRILCDRLRSVAEAIPAGHCVTNAQFNRWLECEESFHTRVIVAAHNRWLIKVINEVRILAQVFAAQRDLPRLLTRELADVTVSQHEEFLEILEERDSEKASAWMRAHIRLGRDMVLRQLSTDRGPAKL